MNSNEYLLRSVKLAQRALHNASSDLQYARIVKCDPARIDMYVKALLACLDTCWNAQETYRNWSDIANLS